MRFGQGRLWQGMPLKKHPEGAAMRLQYSSTKRTTERYTSTTRSITKLRSRKFNIRTSPAKGNRQRIDWGALLALLAKVLTAVAMRLLGSGKHRERCLRELIRDSDEEYRTTFRYA